MTLLNKTLPEQRRRKLKDLLQEGRLVRVIEAHNGLSGIIADNARIEGRDGDTPGALLRAHQEEAHFPLNRKGRRARRDEFTAGEDAASECASGVRTASTPSTRRLLAVRCRGCRPPRH